MEDIPHAKYLQTYKDSYLHLNITSKKILNLINLAQSVKNPSWVV